MEIAGTEVGREGSADVLSSVHSSLPYFPEKMTGGFCHGKKKISGNSLAAQKCQSNIRAMLP